LSLLAGPARAQSQAILSLETTTTALQTGQFYEVNVRLDEAAEVWLADIEISYDPALLYVVGTVSGQPIQQGPFFDPGSSVVVRNGVQDNLLVYTISLLAPADPASGGGVVGTFRIYPLGPGTTQLLFSRAELDKAIFEERDGQRVGVGAEALPFTPVLLELTISGDPVPPPSEATATPLPTETFVPQPGEVGPTPEPTLVNVTAAPRPPGGGGAGGVNLPIWAVVIGVLVVIIGVLAVLLLRQRRKGE
jgi:hypothetical protein